MPGCQYLFVRPRRRAASIDQAGRGAESASGLKGYEGREVIMDQDHFGIEQITQEDRAYKGSRFSEVRDAIFANPYQKVWGREGEPPVPHHEVKLANMLRGLLPFGRHYYFGQACKRTVDSNADLRWGPDRKGFRRIIHTNGVCLTGVWEITEKTDYSGYFRQGSRGLFVARYSCGTAQSVVASFACWRWPGSFFQLLTPTITSRFIRQTSSRWRTCGHPHRLYQRRRASQCS